ncbi:metabotropic glutamate receptor 3 [Hydra vulgaris]|uniref:Metabotropic glutamate receptor 3 n=1 Tax=Hydra vulgaris TaxID=6087 RepID=A0ABM4C6R6_HYDVU
MKATNYWMLFVLLVKSSENHQISELDNIYKLGCHYNKTSTNLDADFIFGALFPIQDFNFEDQKYLYSFEEMSIIEAFLYTIEKINNNSAILPNITLGFDMRNSCNNVKIATTHVTDFMIDTKYFLNKQKSLVQNNTCSCLKNKKSLLATVIGGKSHTISIVMSNLLQIDQIPQIAYGSSESYKEQNNTYSEKNQTPKRYLSTIPPDVNQILAIIHLIEHFNWTFPFLIAADDDFGRNAIPLMQKKLEDKNRCLAALHLFDVQHPEYAFEKILMDLKLTLSKTTVVILLCEYEQAKNIIEAVNERGILNLTWIGIESWATNIGISMSNLTIQNNGIISVKKTIPKVSEFEDFFDKIIVKSHLPNVWFEGFWESFGISREDLNLILPAGEFIKNPNYYNIMSAVYAAAYGLHKYLNCTEKGCQNINEPICYKKLWKDIIGSSFIIPGTNQNFSYNENGDVVSTTYEYIAWEIKTSNNQTEIYTFGNWNLENNEAHAYINFSELKKRTFKSIPTSKCSKPCKPGNSTIFGKQKCCWECAMCDKNYISVDGLSCSPCPKMSISNKNRTICHNLTNVNLSLKNKNGQVIFALSLIGTSFGLSALFVFFKNWNSPIVRASSREMSTTQLISNLLLFFLPLMYLHNLTPIICGLRITWFSILYAYVISFILMKTYRLLRVFRKKRFSKISRFLKNKYQIGFSVSLVVIQLVAEVIWLFANPPEIQQEIDEENFTIIYYCGIKTDILLYCNVIYIILLSLVSGYMAFRARKLPQNYNEAHYIALAMFITCLSWALFIFLHAISERKMKNFIFLVMNLINNFSLLTILYSRRFIVILFYPELRDRNNFTKMRKNATVTAFLNENEINNEKQKVISFDFDKMFDSYRQKNKNSIASRSSMILKKNSTKKCLKTLDNTKKNTKTQDKENDKMRNNKTKNLKLAQTMKEPNNKLEPTIKRSLSLDNIKTYRNKAFEHISDISSNKMNFFENKAKLEQQTGSIYKKHNKEVVQNTKIHSENRD